MINSIIKSQNPNLKLSILVPSYNDEAYIKQCISSLLENDRNDFEVIVSDDCSDDSTISILESFKDERLILVKSSTRLGSSNNWKKCLNLARGDWIHFLASDDYYSSGSVENILDSLKDKNTVYLIKHLCFKDGHKEIFEVQCNPEKLKKIFNSIYKIDWSHLLKFSNHDELVLTIFPRTKAKILSHISKYSVRSSFMYWVYAIFYHVNLAYINDGAVMKRYNHKIKRAKGGDLGKNKKNALGLSFAGFYGDLYNSIIIPLYYRDPIMMFKLLTFSRYHSTHKGGFYGLTYRKKSHFHPGPLVNLFLSPILIAAKNLNLHKKFKA
tara:strand:+ start:659 stop:1633 length:975 start_codon:yes stop_codon:yes gene_type:complete